VTPADAQGAIGTVGIVAALGLFLPNLDHSWNSDPRNGDQVWRLRLGESLYLGVTAAVTLLASYANGSPAPFVLGFGLALLIVGTSEYAMRRRSPAKDATTA
jgi:hypothetical protein